MRQQSGDDRVLTVLVIPSGSGGPSRTLRIPYSELRRWAWGVGVCLAAAAMMLGSWWYFAARSVRVGRLEAEVSRNAADRERVAALAAELERLEAGYSRIRGLFGTDDATLPSSLWLPPAAGGSTSRIDPADAARPTSWPLTDRGFVTRGLLEDGRAHPGIDIAVPSDSYVRAAGAGTVAEVGEDPTYGFYVVIDHGEGLRSLYGHASITLVQRGQAIRRNEVIALSGSTGRSTAPHLHFEITRDGSPVDPLQMVEPP